MKSKAIAERQRIFDEAIRFDGWCAENLVPYYEYCTKETIDGMWLEFGVWRGHTINILATLTNKTVWGFDSFKGLPEEWIKVRTSTGESIGLPKGYYDMQNKLPALKLLNIQIIPGWFEQILPTFTEEHRENCAVIHIDSDLYSSCKTIFNYLRNKIVPGTIILFDELIGHEKYPYTEFADGEMKAWLEEDFSYKYLAYTHGPQVGVKII
jgi:hypothetical protein